LDVRSSSTDIKSVAETAVAAANYELSTSEVLPILHAHDGGGDIGATHEALPAAS